MESRFWEYIDYVCGGIRSTRTRAEISDELLSHLEERYEQNRAVGQDEILAQTLAEEQMGDREQLRQKFAALYRFYTPDYLRTALNCLLFGLFFIFTRLSLFLYADRILPFVGQTLILYALYRLRGINKPIEVGSWIYCVYLLADILRLFLSLYFAPDRFYVYVIGVIAVLLLTAAYTALFWGLDEACAANTVYGDKAPHLILCALSLWWASFLLCLVVTYDGTFTVTDWQELGAHTVLPLLITYFGFRRAKKILCRSDPEFSLKHLPTKRGKRIFAAVLCAFLLLPFIAMCGAAFRTPTAEPYSTADTAESAGTVAAARQHALDLGLPAEVVADLPDSEVLRYRSAQRMEAEETYPSDLLCTLYVFYTMDSWGTNSTQPSEAVRILYAFDGFDAQKVHLRDGFYFWFSPEHCLGYSEQDQQTFHLILGERDGELCRAQPFLSYPDADTYAGARAGFDFAFPKHSENRRAYFANSAVMQHPMQTTYSYITGEYYHQWFPLYIEHRNHKERAEARFTNRVFYSGIHATVDIQQYGTSFDYQPAFYGVKGEWRLAETDNE